MSSMHAQIRRPTPATAYLWTAVPVAALFFMRHGFVAGMFNLRVRPTMAVDWGALWTTWAMALIWGVVGLAWAALHDRDRVGRGTRAGLDLAVFTVAMRVVCDMALAAGQFERVTSVYDHPGPIGALVWIHRNVTLVAYGFGMALAVGSCAVEMIRRRRAPEWMRGLDP